jgi:class 3 adenylate cyclase
VGDTVNLSARLMSMAIPGQVLCDETTQRATANRFEFDTGSNVLVKGKNTAIKVEETIRLADPSIVDICQ